MKRLAGWLLLALAAGLLVACGDSIDDLMEQAGAQQEQGRYQSAIADYRNVLQEDPDHAEARFRLGEVSLIVGDNSGAEEALRRAARLGIGPERVQPLLATALLRQNKPAEVLRQIDPESVSDRSLRAQLLAAHAEAHAQADRLQEARQSVDAALEQDRRSLPALVMAARLAQATGDQGEATLYLDRALEVDADSAAAWLARAEVERQVGNRESAEEAYRRVLELPARDITAEEQFTARGRLTEMLMTQGRTDEARDEVATMLRQSSRHPYSNYLAGMIALGDDELSRANDHLQRMLSASPESIPGKALMGDLRYRQEQHEQAISLLRDVVSARPNDLRSRLILGSALREVGDTRQATRVLAAGAREFAGNPQALAVLARAAGEDIDAVIADLGRVQGMDAPAARQARMGLAQALLAEGPSDPAMALLQDLQTDDAEDEFSRRQLLALAALRGDQMEQALAQAESLARDYPQRAGAHNLLGGVHFQLGNRDAARRAFEQARQLESGEEVRSLINLAMLSSAEGQFEQAVGYIEQAQERAPDNVAVKLQLASLHRERGDNAGALRAMERAVQAHPESQQAAVAMARLQLAVGSSEDALSAANRAVQLAPGSALPLALQGLARLGANDAAGAVESLRAANQLSPDDPEVRFQLARALAASGEDSAARATLEQLIRDYPERVEPQAAMARMQLRAEQHQEALETARRLQQLNDGTAEGALLEGHALSASGDERDAMEAYQRAVAAGSRDALGPLVALRQEAGESDPAAPLETWIEANPSDLAARASLAEWYGQHGDYAGMVRQYEALMEHASEPPPALVNNLAWGYSQIGDDRALETARQALELAPGNPAIMDTLGWIELQEGNAQRAVDLLSRAVERLPGNPEIRYHYGVALAEAGEHSAARQQLQRALDEQAGARWAADARRHLDNLPN